MGIFSFLSRKKRNSSTPLTDEDRRHALEVRRINAEIKKARRNAELERAKLEYWQAQQEVIDIQSQYMDDDEDNYEEVDQMTPDMMLMSLFMNILNKNAPQGGQPPSPSQHPPTPHPHIQAQGVDGRELSMAEMAQIYESVPQAVRPRLKKLTDDQLEAQIRSFVPDISSNSLKNALDFIRSQ